MQGQDTGDFAELGTLAVGGSSYSVPEAARHGEGARGGGSPSQIGAPALLFGKHAVVQVPGFWTSGS